MFESMINELKLTGKHYEVLKSHLNKSTFSKTLAKNPKILVISCHGSNENPTTELFFESENIPTVVEEISAPKFTKMFALDSHRKLLTKVQLVIISACHS